MEESKVLVEATVDPGFAPPKDDHTAATRFLTFLNAISGYILFFMMLLITVDVTGRYVFSSPIPGTLEFTEFLIVFVVFFSLAYVQLTKRHICVELVTQRLPRRVGDGLAVVVLVIAAVFFLLMGWQSWFAGVSSFEYREASDGLVQIPVYPPKLAIPFGAVLIAFQLLRDAWKRLQSFITPG